MHPKRARELLSWAVLSSLTGCGGEPAMGALWSAGGSPASSDGGSGAHSAGGASVPGASGSSNTGGGVVSSGGMNGGAGAGGAGSTGAAGALTGGGGAGGTAANLVGVFVAQGHEGRITRSCDDGLTFPFDESADDQFRCFSDADHDCDHSELAGRGLAFGDGSFVATWGWGHPGKLQRSLDGKAWTDVMTQTPTFADLAYGNSLFVACGNPTRISSDGQNWQMGGKLSFDFNYRGIEFVPTAGGTFVVTGESGAQRAISFSHDGKTWMAASQRPDACGQELRGMVGSDSVMIVASAQGHICRSSDADTWTYVPVTDRFTSPPLWTGSKFRIYSGDKLFESADGQSWTEQDIEPKGISIGPLAQSPQGTLVAANDGWQVWYEKQQFFRSVDGLHWDVLPKSAFTGSHPINYIAFGYVSPSAGCGRP